MNIKDAKTKGGSVKVFGNPQYYLENFSDCLILSQNKKLNNKLLKRKGENLCNLGEQKV